MAINFSDLGGGGGGKALVYKEFLSTSSWTAPSDVTQIKAFVCGGGGGGVNSTSGATDGFYGGHGSVQETILTVVPGTAYTITIGAGGAKSTSGLGNSGSSTSIGSLFTLNGADGGGSGNVYIFTGYNSLNESGPAGSGGQGGRSGKTNAFNGGYTGATKGINGKGGGGGAHIDQGGASVPGADGGGIPWVSGSDNTRTLGPDAQANSGAGGASQGLGSNRHGNGGSGYILLTYSTSE
jgi:hypothetical protein